MRGLLLISLSACATTTSTCPVGSKLIVSTSADGRVEACATEDRGLLTIPVPGRTGESASGTSPPSGMPGGIEGPFTSWYANGNVHSHGSYRTTGTRSVPEGLWGFWYPDGSRQSLGAYANGEPAGCFALWDANGQVTTGRANGSQLQ